MLAIMVKIPPRHSASASKVAGLLLAGAAVNPNSRNNNQNMPLDIAATRDIVEVANLFLARVGVDPNACDSDQNPRFKLSLPEIALTSPICFLAGLMFQVLAIEVT